VAIDEAEPMIILETSSLKVVVDEDHGGEVVFVGHPDGPNVLFHERWASPLPAADSTTYGSGTLDWLSRYRGGWQVMFPSAGSESTVDGVPHPVHGEVSMARGEVVERGATELILRVPTRLPLQLTRRFRLDPERPVLQVSERAENEAGRSLACAWGHHPAFAAVPGTRIDLPPGPVHVDADLAVPEADLAPGTSAHWPAVKDRNGRDIDLSVVPPGPVERVCYLPNRPAGWAAVRDLAGGRGVAMAWDVEAFPHLWVWEQIGGWRFPFFGRARIIALEPASCWPADGLAAAVERGRASTIGPHGTASGWLTIALFTPGDRPVGHVDRGGTIQIA
jgi:galactose mutarotase-like enzyme